MEGCIYHKQRTIRTNSYVMMDDYFRDMIDEGWIAIYMDDILIHARTKEDLEKRTKRVLKRLKEHDVYIPKTRKMQV
jgi:NDP-sugar pyrophosphorylase family protein